MTQPIAPKKAMRHIAARICGLNFETLITRSY
jgi:hypothetical protein